MMTENDNGYSAGAVAYAFLAGALIGTGVALLLAPQSGAKTRKLLNDYAEQAEDEIRDKVKTAKSALDATIEKGKEFVAEKKAMFSAAS